jgi:hemerythrin-like domain-containing protein
MAPVFRADDTAAVRPPHRIEEIRMRSTHYEDMTRQELYDLAQERGIEGRSDLSKQQLVEALELEETGPDAVRLLLEQHDEIRRLFAEWDELSSRPSKRKEELVRELITILVKHAKIEEQIFYPAVAAEVEGQHRLVDESLEEHHAAELMLNEIDRMEPESDRFDAKVTVLKEITIHHLQEEEEELFPQVMEQLSEERRRELGGAMLTAWKVAPTRPHPHAPATPPGNLVTAIPATVIDLTVGAARGVGRLVKRR